LSSLLLQTANPHRASWHEHGKLQMLPLYVMMMYWMLTWFLHMRIQH
jgi:hypothetical protein